METIQVISCEEDIFAANLHSFIPSEIYISLGSKYNDDNVVFEDVRCKSNAQYQMFPGFLRNKNNVLLIIFDYFTNSENLEKNKEILSTAQLQEQFPIKILIFNLYDIYGFDVQMPIYLMNYILGIFSMKSEKTSIMMCNFIKYKNEPSVLETRRAENFIREIKLAIQLKNIPESEIFYEWFGYNYMFYNIICNCKYIPIGFFQSMKKIFDEKQQLNREMIAHARARADSGAVSSTELKKILFCLNHCLDISYVEH